MTRALALALALTALLLGTVASAAAPPAAAQSAGVGVEGSWLLTLPRPGGGPADQQLASFLPGGVILATNAPSFEDPEFGLRVYSTEGHGAWSTKGGGRYSFAIVFLYFDQDETLWASLTVRGSVALDATGDRFAGTYGIAVADPSGAELFSEDGLPLSGSRIRAP